MTRRSAHVTGSAATARAGPVRCVDHVPVHGQGPHFALAPPDGSGDDDEQVAR
jgi:hypothetical protein